MARFPRRWLQFSLRTFLIAVTLFAIWLSVQFNRPRIAAENLDQLDVIATMPIDLHQIEWSRDGSRVAFLAWQKPAEVREAKTLFRFGSLGVGKAPIHVAFSPDRNVVAYCENNKKVEILWLDTGKVKTFETGNDQPSMEFSPDGTILATGGYGTRAALWDIASGELMRTLDVGPTAGGLTTVFSKDGKTVAVGHRNSLAQMFDVASGKRIRVLAGQMTQGLRFDPTGKRLAVSYVNGDIAIYDAQTGDLLCRAPSGAVEMYKVDWSPDGRMLASAGLKGDIILWDPTDLSVLRRISAPEWVIDVKFTPDGTRLITAGGSQAPGGKREVRVWAVPQPWTRWLPWK